MSTVLETKYAVVIGRGKGERVYSRFHRGFVDAPTAFNLMNQDKAEEVARREGGKIIEVAVRDSFGPCCYRTNQH